MRLAVKLHGPLAAPRLRLARWYNDAKLNSGKTWPRRHDELAVEIGPAISVDAARVPANQFLPPLVEVDVTVCLSERRKPALTFREQFLEKLGLPHAALSGELFGQRHLKFAIGRRRKAAGGQTRLLSGQPHRWFLFVDLSLAIDGNAQRT